MNLSLAVSVSKACHLALLESFKIQYLQFLAYTKTPQYKANLQQLLDQEKVSLPVALAGLGSVRA